MKILQTYSQLVSNTTTNVHRPRLDCLLIFLLRRDMPDLTEPCLQAVQSAGRGNKALVPSAVRRPTLAQVPQDRGPHLVGLVEERGVPVDGVELVVDHVPVASGAQGLRDLPLLPDGEEDVALHADDQRRLAGTRQPRGEARLTVRPRGLHREAVDGPRDAQQRVGILGLLPDLGLLQQVPLDLELRVAHRGARARRVPPAPPLAEAVLPLLA
mmetsp:Transcript_57363/g.149058  ORF Transcript_57363/g.149058 Transcript_57363/m.149058 type:complete len:213 (+) Transcript_57363:299-937(+)